MSFCLWLISLRIMSSRFVHVVTCVRTVFLVMAKYYSTVYIYHILLIHSCVDRVLSCFHLFAIVNNASRNRVYKCLRPCFKYIYAFGIYSDVELLDHIGSLHSSFIIFLTHSTKDSITSTSWPMFVVLHLKK